MSTLQEMAILRDIAKVYGKELTPEQKKVAMFLYDLNYGIESIVKYL